MIKWNQINCFHEWKVVYKRKEGIFAVGNTVFKCSKCGLTKSIYGSEVL